jgi:hypothetical protein
MLAHLILDTVEGAIISKRSMLVANATGRKKLYAGANPIKLSRFL